MNNVNYIQLISENHPNVGCSANNEFDYSTLEWVSGDEIPTKDVLDVEWVDFVRRKKQDEINTYRDNVFLGNEGFWFQGNIYECDGLAKSNVTGAITAVVVGAPLPSNYTWRSKQNINVPMNAQSLTAMGVSMGSYISTIFSWTWTLKGKLDTITDIDLIEGFNPADYWPNNNFDGSGPGGITTMQSIQTAAIKLATDYPQ
jgi:hypothetical protein